MIDLTPFAFNNPSVNTRGKAIFPECECTDLSLLSLAQGDGGGVG